MLDNLADSFAPLGRDGIPNSDPDLNFTSWFSNIKPPRAGWRFRLFDLFIVLAAAPSALLLMAAIAVIIKLENPGAPILFFQTRYGRFGKPFRIVKFRSMVPDADAFKLLLLDQSEDRGAGFKLKDDPRITPCGRFLRSTYLDELPQLWNVLMGEMAIVGPRANSADPATLEEWQRLRLIVRPGMTGSWQAMRSKPTNFVERCKIDLDYIAKKSLRTDIAILLRTAVIMVIRPTGK